MVLGDIAKKIYKLTKTNSTSYASDILLIDINNAYSRITSLIIQSDGRWQWDDDNQPATDGGNGIGGQQNGTTALIANQQDYSFPGDYLKLLRVEVKPNGGTYFYKLFPRDVADPMWGAEVTGIDTITIGTPMKYDVTGHSVFLYPVPNYSQAASLKFYFQRGQIDFTTNDLSTGTISPGFASLFHDLIAYLVAYDYAVYNLPKLAQGYLNVVQRKELELKNYYAWRDPDDSLRLSNKPISFR